MAAIFFAGSVFGYFVAFMNFLDRRSMRKESSEKEVSEKDLLMDIEVREKGFPKANDSVVADVLS